MLDSFMMLDHTFRNFRCDDIRHRKTNLLVLRSTPSTANVHKIREKPKQKERESESIKDVI